MKSDVSKESYDTIGLDDDKIVVGAQKINLNENREEKIKGVGSDDSVVESGKGVSNSSGVGFVEKMKNLLKFGKGENQNKTEAKMDEKSIEVTATNSQEVSCKDKLMKKLQENVEVEQSYQTFLVLLLLGLGLLCVSLMFLPVIILSPYKFVLCFSFGSLIILTSFIFVYGTKKYFEILFSQQRFAFTCLFLGSIILGIIFAWSQYFLLSILCSIFQLISLIVFTLSFIPGGKAGISFIGRMVTSPFSNLWMRIRGQSYLPQ
jgi:hypothetical protein